MGEQRKLSLEVGLDLGVDEDGELLGFYQVRAPCKLPDEHIEQEAAFVNELELGVAQLFLARQRGDVEPWEPIDEGVSKR
jgi:hypothetical protein